MWYFGTAGTPDAYDGNSINYVSWLKNRGLNAFEYQCGRGVRVSADTAAGIRSEAEKHGVRLSLHAPYFISLSSVDPQKRLNSIDYILQSARAADMLGAGRIIVHSGSVSGMEREEAVALAAQTLKQAIEALDGEGLGHIAICPETMGKQNQLGTVAEVCGFCKLDDRLIPCVDFGHLYARSLGAVEGYEASAAVLDEIKNALGAERMRNLHIHFSHIEFTAGGEKRHLNFRDGLFGPDFEPLCRALEDAGAEPVIISESAGMQDEDALEMQRVHSER